MKGVLDVIKGISRVLHFLAGVALVFIVVLTTADVVLRAFKRPILGTYEIVTFTGAVVILFALPLSSWIRSHIYVDFFILKFPRRVQNAFHVVTRCMAIFLFFLFGWNILKYAADLQRTARSLRHPEAALLSHYLCDGYLLLCAVPRSPVRPRQDCRRRIWGMN